MNKEDVWSFLEKTGCYQDKPSTIITRCPFCGDSRRKRYNYGHLYISKEVPFFICFRCNEKGHLKKLLKAFINNNLIDANHAKKVLAQYNQGYIKFKT